MTNNVLASPKLRLALLFYAAIFFEGIMLSSVGPVLPELRDRTGSTLGAIGILFTANSLGYILGSLAAGRSFGRLPGNYVLAAALVWTAAVAVFIPFIGETWLLIVAFAAFGFALGFIDVGTNTLIVWVFRSDVPPYMNALHLSFAVGAFVSPLIVDRFAVVNDDATSAYWLFAALMLPLALALTRHQSPSPPDAVSDAPGGQVLRRYALFLGLMALFFFMHVGAELSYGGWIFSYADEIGIGNDTTGRVLNSVFWGGLVIGRLLAIPLSMRLSSRSMLLLDLVGAAASIGLIVLLPDWSPALWLGTIGFGVSIASVFASGMNYTEERMPITSGVTSLLIVGAGLGSMTLPWVVGRAFDARGPEMLIYLVGITIAGAFVVFGAIDMLSKRRGYGSTGR
ncbi:MAG: MFS transporter [Acidimicrobiia bacterium]